MGKQLPPQTLGNQKHNEGNKDNKPGKIGVREHVINEHVI
jgi:hypothetical protein